MLRHYAIAVLFLALPIMVCAQQSSSSIVDLPDAPVHQIETGTIISFPKNIALEPRSKMDHVEYTTYKSSQLFVLAGLGTNIEQRITSKKFNSQDASGYIIGNVAIDGAVLYVSHRFHKRGGKIGKSIALSLNIVRGISHFYQ